MRKTALLSVALLSLILAGKGLQAQVSVVLFPSQAKQFFIDDFWKATIINLTNATVNTNIQYEIRNNSGEDVLKLVIRNSLLNQGANRLNTTDGIKGSWDYGNTESAMTLQSTGRLPYGQYTFCITVFDALTNKPLGSNCDEREVAPMLPPQLLSPMDKDTVTVQYPLLTWLPPRPLNGITVMYSLVLTSINKGQTEAEALEQNPPLLKLDGLTNTYTMYPVTAPALEYGKNYVWQVAASCDGYNLGVTDMWEFTLKPPPPAPQEAIIYPFASIVSDGHFYVTHGIFRFAYNNKNNDTQLRYVIKRMDKKEDLKPLPVISIKPGTNKIEVDVRHNHGLRANKYYGLEITDTKGQVYKLLFMYITN